VVSAAGPDQFPKDGLPEIAFIGRSNVGKSSLLNVLTAQKNLARVSSTPGRTRWVNFFRYGSDLYLADLPGYGYAKVPEAVRVSWERLVTSYMVDRAPLALCLFLVDVRHDPTDGDATLREFLEQNGLRYALVATKADKLGRSERGRRLTALREGWVAGAALDVYEGEFTGPPPEDLWQLPNILITPHTSVGTDVQHAYGTEVFCENLRHYLKGEPLLNVLDWERGY
jgi:GTP-binding protein